MTAKIIDGTKIAADVREEIRAGVKAMQERYGYTPGLSSSAKTRLRSRTWV